MLEYLSFLIFLVLTHGYSDEAASDNMRPVQYICNGNAGVPSNTELFNDPILSRPPGKRGPQGVTGQKGDQGLKGIKGDIGPQCQCDLSSLENQNRELMNSIIAINQKLSLLMCPPLAVNNNENLRVDVDGTALLGTVATFTCGSGTTVIGANSATCVATGKTAKWSHDPPTCKFCRKGGIETGEIPSNMLLASSSHPHCNDKERWRLNAKERSRSGDGWAGSWCAGTSSVGQYIGVDFQTATFTSGLITQGRHGSSQRVTKYKVGYYKDSTRNNLEYVTDNDGNIKIFDGNVDMNTPVKNYFSRGIEMFGLRIYPVAWSGHMSLRFEVITCN